MVRRASVLEPNDVARRQSRPVNDEIAAPVWDIIAGQFRDLVAQTDREFTMHPPHIDIRRILPDTIHYALRRYAFLRSCGLSRLHRHGCKNQKQNSSPCTLHARVHHQTSLFAELERRPCGRLTEDL